MFIPSLRSMAKEFWGIEVKPGKTIMYDPGDRILHLSQASLGVTKKGSENTLIFLKVNDQKLVLGTLAAAKCAQITFDLFLEKEFELSHSSRNTSVYFCGYKASLDENDSEYSGVDGKKKGSKHTVILHPAKNAGKMPANSGKSKQQTPKSAVSVTCKSCSRAFNSEKALESHRKAKHLSLDVDKLRVNSNCELLEMASSLRKKKIDMDLQIKILLHLPVKSIIRFRLACKKWQSETLHPNFIEDHLNFALQVRPGPPSILQSNLWDSEIILFRSNGSRMNIPLHVQTINIHGSTNGILCITLSLDVPNRTDCSRRIVLLNPVTRQQSFLPDIRNMPSTSSVPVFDVYFGFHPVTKEYKVIAIAKLIQSPQFSACYFFTVGLSVSWTEVHYDNEFQPVSDTNAAELNGSMYFVSYARRLTVFSLNLRDQTLTEVPFPDHVPPFDYVLPISKHLKSNIFCLSELKGSICFTVRDQSSWIMYQLRGEQWVMMYNVTPVPFVYPWKPLSIDGNRIYCTASKGYNYSNEMLCCVDLDKNSIDIKYDFDGQQFFVGKHVETLVTLPMMTPVTSNEVKPSTQVIKKDTSSDEDDSSDESSDEEPPKAQLKKTAVSMNVSKPFTKVIKKDSGSSEDEDDGSDDKPLKAQENKDRVPPDEEL